MSHTLISRSSDINQLRNEGFEVEIRGAHLLLHNVPYLNSSKKVEYGTLVSDIRIEGDKAGKPQTHVIHFFGDYPCNMDGSPISAIKYVTQNKSLGNGININHSFSNKPVEGYRDYYHKMSTYCNILSAPARAVEPSVTACTFKVIQSEDELEVFQYLDTNSSRAEIGKISEIFLSQKIAIIGLGGTGSYILDQVAKTPVSEIHLFDGDIFYQHNAFRAPGAPSIEELETKPAKVNYFKKMYSRMHRGIVPHAFFLDGEKLAEWLPFDYVFLSIDEGEIKEQLINCLEKAGVSFVDVGIGVENVNDRLFATVRTTSSSPLMREHIRGNNRISFSKKRDDHYASNIQIAELNALNATQAVIKWKKQLGFYQDDEREHHCTMNINANILINEDFAP